MLLNDLVLIRLIRAFWAPHCNYVIPWDLNNSLTERKTWSENPSDGRWKSRCFSVHLPFLCGSCSVLSRLIDIALSLPFDLPLLSSLMSAQHNEIVSSHSTVDLKIATEPFTKERRTRWESPLKRDTGSIPFNSFLGSCYRARASALFAHSFAKRVWFQLRYGEHAENWLPFRRSDR